MVTRRIQPTRVQRALKTSTCSCKHSKILNCPSNNCAHRDRRRFRLGCRIASFIDDIHRIRPFQCDVGWSRPTFHFPTRSIDRQICILFQFKKDNWSIVDHSGLLAPIAGTWRTSVHGTIDPWLPASIEQVKREILSETWTSYLIVHWLNLMIHEFWDYWSVKNSTTHCVTSNFDV